MDDECEIQSGLVIGIYTEILQQGPEPGVDPGQRALAQLLGELPDTVSYF